MNFVTYVYLLLATILILHSATLAETDDAAKKANKKQKKRNDEKEKEKERLSKMEGHMKPLGSVGPYFDLFTMDGFPSSPREFFNKYAIPSTPLLMKNAAKISPAFTKWSDEYFLNHPGSAREQVFAEGRKKEIRSEPGSVMSFKQFVEKYNKTDMYMVHGLPRHIRSDVVIPPPLQCEPVIAKMMDVVTWFSSGGTRSVLHNDDVDNINCLYRGNKTLIFLNPHDSEDVWNNVIDEKSGSYSSMDVDAVDFTKFPDIAKVRFAKVDMQAGDCLYIPYRWFHQVNSFGSNLAVNLWWNHETSSFFDLTDEICGDFTGRNTIADIYYPGMDESEGPYGKPDDSEQPSTEEFLKQYETGVDSVEKKITKNKLPEVPVQKGLLPEHPPGQPVSFSDDYEVDYLQEKNADDEDPQFMNTDPEDDPYIEPEEDSLSDKIFRAILKVRKPVHITGLKKYVLKKMPGPSDVWDDRCQEILINYFGMLDQNKDTVLTVEDADLYYAHEKHTRAQNEDVTAFFQDDLYTAIVDATKRKEKEYIKTLLDRGEVDIEQVARIFGDKMAPISDQLRDEL